MILSSRVKALVPLKHYLGQIVSRSTTETIYNPFQFWRFYELLYSNAAGIGKKIGRKN